MWRGLLLKRLWRDSMKLSQHQIESAALLLGKIDSGCKNILLETVNTEAQVEVKLFGDGKIIGVFYAAVAYERFWIAISFDSDTARFNHELAALVENSFKKSGFASCMIWVRNSNGQIIEYLKKRFGTRPDCGPYYYASTEFIMRREAFGKTRGGPELDILPYNEKHMDDYLSLLDGAMAFVSPPPDFAGNKEHYLKRFAALAADNSFEAFWKNGELVGLYWREGAEIDVLAVAAGHQRKGYGSVILTRVVEMAFANTTDDYAYLYAVDWNPKGQAFYRKYGMEENGHSYRLPFDQNHAAGGHQL